MHLPSSSLAFLSPGPTEMLVLGVIALLLYGGRLPEVAREWGKTFSELRRTLTGVQDEFNSAINENELYYDDDGPSQLEYHPEFRDDSVTDAATDAAAPDVIDAMRAVASDADVREQELPEESA